MKPVSEIRLENLEILIQESGTAESLAEKAGLSPVYISQIKSRAIDQKTGKPRNLGNVAARKLERGAGKPPNWMDSSHTEADSGLDANTLPGPAMQGAVPLISWVTAGDWCGVVDNFQPGDAEEWLSVPRAHGPHTFALKIRGVSMEPRYRDGSIIFVDPDKQADHSSNVVVRMESEAEATFKQLVIEGDKRFLRALNPDWPGPKLIEINGDATICGVVIGQFIPD